MEKSVSFLFGSGADTAACKKLKSGDSFAEALLLGKYGKERKELLGEDFAEYQLIYPQSSKVFIQSIVENKEEAQKIFPEKFDICYNYATKKEEIDYSGVIRPMCKDFYDIIHSEEQEHAKDIRNFFLKNAVFFDSLDEKFNSLRNTEFNKNAKRVINAYVTIFIFMFKSLYDTPEGFQWTYENIFEVLQRDYDILSDITDGNYYSIVKKSGISCKIITTNYTELSEKLTEKPVTYLHGKLNWFEDLKNLTVYDCTNKDELNKLIPLVKSCCLMPFILIPSGIKPIICKRQIKEFNKMIEKLDHSNILCVVGYRFNSEDNHINSIIAEWIREPNHQLFYFNFNEDVNFSRLRWADLFSIKDIEYHDNYEINFIKIEEKIVNIIVNESNSMKAFSTFMNQLERS